MAEHRRIGSRHGVAIEVAAWDGAHAEVDLSCACMFVRETGMQQGPAGGLLHLDEAFDGALTGLRRDGHFRAGLLDTLLIACPPAGMAARAVLLIGLGDAAAWHVEVSGRAAGAALRAAVQLRARSAAFAPSVLDSGIDTGGSGDLPGAMMRALLAAIDAERRLVDLNLAPPLALTRWVFDVGAPRFTGAAERFQAAFIAAGEAP